MSSEKIAKQKPVQDVNSKTISSSSTVPSGRSSSSSLNLPNISTSSNLNSGDSSNSISSTSSSATGEGCDTQNNLQGTTTIKAHNAKPSQNIVFIHKLYNILENSDLKDLIWWSSNGHSFFIKPNEEFSKALAKYFKHTNITSFVRQLNIYGFHKITNLNESSSSIDSQLNEVRSNKDSSAIKIWEFKHSAGIFKKGDPESLKFIKRRSSSRNSSSMSSRKSSSLPNSSSINKPNSQNGLLTEFDGIDRRVKNSNSFTDHLNILRSQSNFTPYSSNDNIINIHGQYPNIPQNLVPNRHQTQQVNVSQNALNITNEFMLEQFNTLSGDILQILNVLQDFVTLQTSVTLHENPTKPMLNNFQNQYNLLYHNISNFKTELMNNYQNLASNFNEQQQQQPQAPLQSHMQGQQIAVALHTVPSQPYQNEMYYPQHQQQQFLTPQRQQNITPVSAIPVMPSNENTNTTIYPVGQVMAYQSDVNSTPANQIPVSYSPTQVVQAHYGSTNAVVTAQPKMQVQDEYFADQIHTSNDKAQVTNGVIRSGHSSTELLPANTSSNISFPSANRDINAPKSAVVVHSVVEQPSSQPQTSSAQHVSPPYIGHPAISNRGTNLDGVMERSTYTGARNPTNLCDIQEDSKATIQYDRELNHLKAKPLDESLKSSIHIQESTSTKKNNNVYHLLNSVDGQTNEKDTNKKEDAAHLAKKIKL